MNKIAGHISQLPIGVYKRLDRGAERDRTHPVAMLMRKPNKYQTSTIYREQMAVHSILQGNGRSAIVRDPTGRATELIPLIPEYTGTGMLAGEKLHATRPPKDDRIRLFYDPVGDDDDGPIMLDDENVVHIPGLTLDGINGLPLIEAAKRNLQISLGTETRIAAQMQNGFQGNIMLQAPPGVFRKQQDAQEFLEAFEERHHDKAKAGKPGLLRDGITANILAMNNTDAQFSEQRMFQRQD
ncbi:MAG TPA: phage portal protein, partial [Pirellulales bacterium]|nr:phage portal protein [Pirellulales bacterium]